MKTPITHLILSWENTLKLIKEAPNTRTKNHDIKIIETQIPLLKHMLLLEKESQRTAFETGKIVGGDFDEYFDRKYNS